MKAKIEIKQGDITESDTEAIVNAANCPLWLGSGVAGAIKHRGGQEIEQEAVSKGPIDIGQAVETAAGRLPFKFVIHAAGMGQDLRTSAEIVHRVTENSLLLADRLGLKSVAFPAIGTGVGGLDIRLCAEKMIGCAFQFADKFQTLKRVEFVLFDEKSFKVFDEVKKELVES